MKDILIRRTRNTYKKVSPAVATVHVIDPNGKKTGEYKLTTSANEIEGPYARAKPGNCVQYKCLATNALRAQLPDGTVHKVVDGYIAAPVFDSIPYMQEMSKYQNSLNWKKLSTSNDLQILQLLAEWDSTLALFTTKLAASQAYGAYKWGLVPLMNDVNAVLSTMRNVSKDPPGLNQKYTDTNTYTKTFQIGGPGSSIDAELKITMKTKFDGHVVMETKSDGMFSHASILNAYDMVGFHPKLSVIWDLVPLSFFVDRFIDIGGAIERFEPQTGWVKFARFSGWKMVTYTIEEKVHRHGIYTPLNGCAQYKVFSRTYETDLGLQEMTFPAAGKRRSTDALGLLMDAAFLSNTVKNSARSNVRKADYLGDALSIVLTGQPSRPRRRR